MGGALFDSLRDRVQGYLQTGDTRAVLDAATLVDGGLFILDRFDPQSCAVVGTLLFIRATHFGQRWGRADETAAVTMFTIVNPVRPDVVPELMRAYFEEHPMSPAP